MSSEAKRCAGSALFYEASYTLGNRALPSDRRFESTQSFDARWLAEAVRFREQAEGVQADEGLVARLQGSHQGVEARIIARAREIGAGWGMDASLSRWVARETLVAWVLGAFAVLTGFGAALAVLGDGSRPVNVVWALLGLLGVHLLSLLAWVVALGLMGRQSGGLAGKLWRAVSARLSTGGNAEAIGLARLRLYARAGLERWWLGAASHGFWLMLLFGMLLGLVGGLALRRYGFVWETTILPSSVFETLVPALGWLPSLLGFPVPDGELVRASGDVVLADEQARRTWSMWLVGCLLTYGLLPRLVLWAFCSWKLAIGRRDVRLYPDDPAFSSLAERLAPPSERMGVSDAAPSKIEAAHVVAPHQAGGAPMAVGIELDSTRVPWPPSLPEVVRDGGVVDSREQRANVQAAVEATKPVRLLLVCDPRLSPDRGSLALIARLSAHAGQCAVWLAGAQAVTGSERLQHWRDALAELGLADSAVFMEEGVAMTWVAYGGRAIADG